MWNRIRSLIIKELQIILRDRKTRIIIVIPPILQIFLFAFASTLEVKNITIGILNRDAGADSAPLIERFRNSPSFVRLDPGRRRRGDAPLHRYAARHRSHLHQRGFFAPAAGRRTGGAPARAGRRRTNVARS